MHLVGVELVQLTSVNHCNSSPSKIYTCTISGSNSRTRSTTNAPCGSGTSTTDECQSRNSSPSKTYTCTILMNINI